MLRRVSTLLGIGDFSRMTFLSVKALRHYHDVGLLAPAEIDPETGYRRYDLAQVPTAQVIRRLRELGMSLEDVRTVIEADDVSARNDAIGAHLRRMEGELEQTRATVKALRLLLDEKAPPSVPVEYRVSGPGPAFAIRERLAYADAFDWLEGAFAELRAAARDLRGERAGPDGALYSSELLEEEHGELVALLPVAAPRSGSGRVEALLLPRVEYAVATHFGPVDDIDRTYAALGTVVAQRAIGVDGPIREDYVVGSADTPDESRHRTEICWPVFQTTPGI
jgi:DNA-binding transcriptional MerR regulator